MGPCPKPRVQFNAGALDGSARRPHGERTVRTMHDVRGTHAERSLGRAAEACFRACTEARVTPHHHQMAAKLVPAGSADPAPAHHHRCRSARRGVRLRTVAVGMHDSGTDGDRMRHIHRLMIDLTSIPPPTPNFLGHTHTDRVHAFRIERRDAPLLPYIVSPHTGKHTRHGNATLLLGGGGAASRGQTWAGRASRRPCRVGGQCFLHLSARPAQGRPPTWQGRREVTATLVLRRLPWPLRAPRRSR